MYWLTFHGLHCHFEHGVLLSERTLHDRAELTCTHTPLQSDHQFRQYSTPIPAAHLPRVFFPALACVCPPSRPAASAWAHRWSPESLLRTEPVIWEISIRASLSVFNNMWKNNIFFREKPGFGIDIMLFHLCTVIRSSTDTIKLKLISVDAEYTMIFVYTCFISGKFTCLSCVMYNIWHLNISTLQAFWK